MTISMRMLVKQMLWTLLAVDRRLRARYLEDHAQLKLQIGGGGRKLEGWLNTDLYPARGVMRMDATARFPFPDATFAFIFSEQMIEHVDYVSAQRMLTECHRVLEPGGTLRIATPDLRFLVELFRKPWADTQQRYVQWTLKTSIPEAPIQAAAFVLNNDVRNWGHAFLYDEEVLGDSLRRAGFAKVRRMPLGESDLLPLRGLEQSRTLAADLLRDESLAMEATKD